MRRTIPLAQGDGRRSELKRFLWFAKHSAAHDHSDQVSYPVRRPSRHTLSLGRLGCTQWPTTAAAAQVGCLRSNAIVGGL